MTKILIDSNILVYASINDDSQKHYLATEYLKKILDSDSGVISLQNITEFSRVLLEKANPKIDFATVNSFIFDFTKFFSIVNYSYETIIRANALTGFKQTHFFDALLVATMQENNISTIVTENVKDFQKILGLTVINPFESNIDL